MTDSAIGGVRRRLQTAAIAITSLVVAIFVFRALPGRLWLDELYTVTLLRADSLSKLWAGIVLGLDGNPPLYLTAAWLVTQATPSAISSVVILKLINVAVTIGALAVLYRLARRVASPLAGWIAVFLLAALNDNVVFVALELRAYALYFLLGMLAALFQQRLIERCRLFDVAMLALLDIALTLVHGFGILYVACIFLAGALSHVRRGWRATLPSLLATLPAVVALACWIPFVIRQTEIVQPYSWIWPPGAMDLVLSLFPSQAALWLAVGEAYGIVLLMVWLRRHGLAAPPRAIGLDDRWQPQRYFALLALGMAGIAGSIWVVSVVNVPIFVPRYFVPQMLVGFALHLLCAELLIRCARHRFPRRDAAFGAIAIVAAPALLVTMLLVQDPLRERIPCLDAQGGLFEASFVHGDMPVIADSPHVWLPRLTYAEHADAYRFPLDWEVVINYPNWARGNAIDYNMMQRIGRWAGLSSVMPTAEILNAYPEFLVIESGRAWLHHLRQTHDITAERLAEARDADGRLSCTLWKVTGVGPRR
jgi:hypothetical protein